MENTYIYIHRYITNRNKLREKKYTVEFSLKICKFLTLGNTTHIGIRETQNIEYRITKLEISDTHI